MQALAGVGITVGGRGLGVIPTGGPRRAGPRCAPTRKTDPMMRNATPKMDKVMNIGAADMLFRMLSASDVLGVPVAADAPDAKICWTKL